MDMSNEIVYQSRDYLAKSTQTSSEIQKKFKWHVRFLQIAKEVSTWSKDKTKVGSVIINPKRKTIVSTGYNGFPSGMEDSQERIDNRDIKLEFTVHAELNAILNAKQSVEGFDLYTYPTMMIPNNCPNCAKHIAASGIKRVFYYEEENLSERWQKLADITKTIYNETGVEYIQVPIINEPDENISFINIIEKYKKDWENMPSELKDFLRSYMEK